MFYEDDYACDHLCKGCILLPLSECVDDFAEGDCHRKKMDSEIRQVLRDAQDAIDDIVRVQIAKDEDDLCV